MVSRTIVVSALLLALSGVTNGQDLFCPFPCFNDSTCTEGAADFSAHPSPNGLPLYFHKDDSRMGKHCACPEGFTGLRCARKYETCNDGNHYCYNNGQCIPGLEDEFGNEQQFCDCSNAVDHNGIKHVGKYCEIPAAEPCNDAQDVFCVNGGYCNEDFEDSAAAPCTCGGNYDGPHCEFTKGSVPDCDLNCQNGGQCKLGLRTFAEADAMSRADNQNYQYCSCPPGFYGLECEVPSSKCGEHHCFNGGTCVVKREAGITKHHCDCSTAHTPSVSYAGRYCQYESTTFCEKNSIENGQLFCVNEGQCKAEGAHLGCHCPDGYHGPICEFHDAEPSEEYENCILPCANGGQCRKGTKDLTFFDRYGPQLGHLNVSHTGDFEHCVCPEGFVGVTCETEVQVCGEGQHACFHGSTCVDNGGDSHACDCEAGFGTFHQLAGPFCEQKSTTICTLDGMPGTGRNSHAFCVNNGKCRAFVDHESEHEGCDCGDMYEGNHCELLKVRVDDWENGNDEEVKDVEQPPPTVIPHHPAQPAAEKQGLGVGAALSIAFVVAAVTGGVMGVFLWLRSKRRHQTENEVIRSTFQPAAERRIQPKQLTMAPQQDWPAPYDDNELVNVEIL